MSQRLTHGVFGYSRWKNDDFLDAIAYWYRTRFHTIIDPQAIVYTHRSFIWCQK